MKKRIKLSTWAKLNNLTYRTAQNYWYKGLLEGEQLPTGTILVYVDEQESNPDKTGTIIYARVSSSQNKSNLKSQAKRLEGYCISKGYKINQIIKEIGSGLNDNRKQLLKLLEKGKCEKIVIEHKDRLTRFGFKYIELLCKLKDIEIEIVNRMDTDRDSLMQDFVSLVTSFCARLYGLRRSKRKTEQIIKALEKKDAENE